MSGSATQETPLFDPFAEGFVEDPYPQYARLREAAPVYQHPLGFWVVSRYDDVSALLRSGASVEERNLAPVDGPMRYLREEVYGDRQPRMDGLSMLDRDPPDHTRLRRLVSKAFTPRAVEALRPRVAELVDGMLDEIARAGTVDLVPALAFPLPFAVIAEMLGTPPTDHERVRELSGLVVRSLEPVLDPDLMRAIASANEELDAIALDMIAWKREHPADDLLTALVQAEEDGDVLSDAELVAQVLLLYIAGHETTVNLLSGGTLALLRHPDQLAALCADPGLVPGAVEELLRYDSPVQESRRITLEPTVVGGVEIPAGSFVLALLASANRDERRWGPDAETLRVDREGARHHVSFGAGVHHCLGASLARLEASVVFERMLARLPGLALAGDVTWNGRINLRGPAALPVTTGRV
ncbi:cytochrome P450 [Prauserella muralis]|uniref:Cytochrome n=1 Tax=Prauserella muralis TaxID=588067 RepID=A0A2V4BCY2_9PSEU|nr:cytochrome P450 [Prauserella muralis]PXY31919.1 cytochrome [Prauserella muralis]TWE13660.1 cytochrome P450 [Prauserella muralis]